MEETLTNCLIKMRDDLSQLRRIRECLDSNLDSQCQSGFSVTWQILEAFNLSLSGLKDDSHKLEVLNALLDSFHYISSHNNEENVWESFGFELGGLCLKFLALIEQTENFEELFSKLLTTMNIICTYTSDLWKSAGRQILNVFINKKLSVASFEKTLQLCISILRKTDDLALYAFTQQNFHLVKTFLKTVQRIGDTEIQLNILEAVFLHVSKDKQLLQQIISDLDPPIKFSNASLKNFQEDSRAYLNALNLTQGGEKKVFSLNCKRIIVGGCALEPPCGRRSFWLDANKSTRRLSTKCLHLQKGPPHNFVIFIRFEHVLFVHIDIQPENLYNIIFKVQNLKDVLSSAKTDDVICTANLTQNPRQNIFEFKYFLEENINGVTDNETSETKKKTSKTTNQVLGNNNHFILKHVPEPNNQSASPDRKNLGIDRIIPDALTLFTKLKKDKLNQDFVTNDSNPPEINFAQTTRLENPKEASNVPEPEELSPQSFIESLSKNLGLDSPNTSNSFESSLLSLKFQKSSPAKVSHKLFLRSNAVFDSVDDESQSMEIGEVSTSDKIKTTEEGLTALTTHAPQNNLNVRKSPRSVISSRKCLELSDTQSDNYFCENVTKKTKPTLPKLTGRVAKKSKKRNTCPRTDPEPKKKPRTADQPTERPSLLDPNGYAYKRWLAPTTSERSQFWLKKLDSLEEKRRKSRQVFEFTDDSDVECNPSKRTGRKRKKNNSLQRKVVANKVTRKANNQPEPGPGQKKSRKRTQQPRKPVRMNPTKTFTKQTLLPQQNQMKDGTRRKTNNSNKNKQETLPVSKNPEPCPNISNSPKEESESYIEDSLGLQTKSALSQQPKKLPTNTSHSSFSNECSPKRNRIVTERGSSFDSVSNLCDRENSGERNGRVQEGVVVDETETLPEPNEGGPVKTFPHLFDEVDLSDVEEDLMKDFEKSECLNGDHFAGKGATKKRRRRTTPVPPDLDSQIQNVRLKIEQETREIVQTFASAATRLINQVQKKNLKSVVTYLKKTDDAYSQFRSNDLTSKLKNIEKVYVYYKYKCSTLGSEGSTAAQISTMKGLIRDWTNVKDESGTCIRNITNKLETLVEKGIDDLSQMEAEHFKRRIVNYASLFYSEFS